MVTERQLVFSFDGKKTELHHHSELDVVSSTFQFTQRSGQKVTWSEVVSVINNEYRQDEAFDSVGYFICHDYEGDLLLDETGTEVMFGANLLATNALRGLFEKIDEMQREEIIKRINFILENIEISDFDHFQLTMLKIFHQTYLTKFEENIELLLDLEDKYSDFGENTKRLIEDSKSNRHKDPSRFIDKGYFNFDYAYLQFSLGYNFYNIKNYEIALEYYDRAYEFWRSKAIEVYLSDIIKSLINCSLLNYETYNTKAALEYNLEALEYTSKSIDIEIKNLEIIILENTALDYMRLKEFANAIKVAEKAHELAVLISNNNRICTSLMTLSQVYMFIDNKKSLSLLEDVYDKYEESSLDRSFLSNIFYYLTLINNDLGNYDIALKYLDQLNHELKISKIRSHHERYTFLKLILSLESNLINLDNPMQQLIEFFNDRNTHTEVRVLAALHILSKFEKDIFTNYDKKRLLEDIMSFAKKFKLVSLVELLEMNNLDIELINQLKNNHIPLVEIRK